MSRRTENEAWHAGFTEACRQWTMQNDTIKRGVETHPITREVPEQYRWSQDYNEMLISQAGGDGDNETPKFRIGGRQGGKNTAALVEIVVRGTVDSNGESVTFTNVPMHHVHAAIALLNDDPYADALKATENNPQAQVNYLYGKDADGGPIKRESTGETVGHAYADTDSMRTKDFTIAELFKPAILRQSGYACSECGAMVAALDIHVTWHNKTLP